MGHPPSKNRSDVGREAEAVVIVITVSGKSKEIAYVNDVIGIYVLRRPNLLRRGV
jgi:hypothetical protein